MAILRGFIFLFLAHTFLQKPIHHNLNIYLNNNRIYKGVRFI